MMSTPVFSQPLSDRTGLVNRMDIESGGTSFEVELVSNFELTNHKFIQEEKRLTIFVNSGLNNNLGEMIIPRDLMNGNFTFYINDEPYYPKISSNDKISFITLNFTGIGNNKIDVIATETPSVSNTLEFVIDDNPSEGGGCLIATAAYGTEMSPHIQQLRETRDNVLLKTHSGQLFMKSFNAFYYSFSPAIADYERQNPVFKEFIKLLLTPMIYSLSIYNHVQLDTEGQIVGVGMGIMALNTIIYIAGPTFILVKLKR